MINRKPSSDKPTVIVVSRDGKVSVRYEQTVIYVDDAAVLGQNVVVKGRNNSTVSVGRVSNYSNRNGLTNTASMKYENGYWWIVTTHSFNWYIGRDRIENVWLKAKKIKEINDEN